MISNFTARQFSHELYALKSEIWNHEILTVAEVVKWQTRSFQVRVPQGVRVRVPPSVQQKTKAQMVDNQLFALFCLYHGL